MAGGRMVAVYRRPRRRVKKLPPKQKKAVSKICKSIISRSSEVKVLDQVVVAQAIYDAGFFFQLSTITQGPAQGQRIGDRLNLKYVDIRLIWDHPLTVTASWRAHLFRWKENTANVNPSVGLYLNAANSTAAAPGNRVDPDQSQYLTTYKDMVCMTSRNSSVNANQGLHIHKKLSTKVEFNAGATTGMGHIYLFLTTDNVLAQASGISGTIRLAYTDA